MKHREIDQLKTVAAVAYQSAQAKLARLRKTQADLRNQLKEMDEALRSSVEGRGDDNDAALQAGADVRWQMWIDQRRSEINSELARLAAQEPEVLHTLRRAFGRKEALVLLEKEAREVARRELARRAD